MAHFNLPTAHLIILIRSSFLCAKVVVDERYFQFFQISNYVPYLMFYLNSSKKVPTINIFDPGALH